MAFSLIILFGMIPVVLFVLNRAAAIAQKPEVREPTEKSELGAAEKVKS